MAKKKKFQLDFDAEGVAEEPKSRSQKKRDSLALQDIGDALIKLAPGQLAKLPLNEDLREALKLMGRITDNEGRRRQRQYIGKLMRECDPAPIQEALQVLQQGHNADSAILHHAERLREALLEADTAEQDRILAPWPQAKTDVLKLIVQAKAESSPKAKRELFRKLRALLEQEE